MKIEKLRNNHKKEIIIGTILIVVIGGALTYKLTHSKYRVTQSIDLGSGVINYKVPDFKIMAMYQQKDGNTCTDDTCYDEITDRMPSSGYTINQSKSYCTLDNVNHDNEAKVYTYEGKHVFENLKKSDKCYLYFDKTITVNDIIASSNAKTTTPNFSYIADTDEGVYATIDGMYDNGTTYYWRGAVTNNYVKFAGFCWRIIRINGDKTLRLIYDGESCHANGTNTIESIAVTSQAYYSTYYNPSYVGWTFTSSNQRPSTTNNNGSVGDSSDAKTQIEKWYNANLNSYDTFIANGKFCNDREIGNGSWSTENTTFYYAGYTRLMDYNTPTFNCGYAGDIYTVKVGLITADEVSFAGGVFGGYYGTSNPNLLYYLYNGQYYWTMSPYYWDGAARMFVMFPNGSFNLWAVHEATLGLRPVINLKSDVTFSSGDGTQNNPYMVS